MFFKMFWLRRSKCHVRYWDYVMVRWLVLSFYMYIVLIDKIEFVNMHLILSRLHKRKHWIFNHFCLLFKWAEDFFVGAVMHMQMYFSCSVMSYVIRPKSVQILAPWDFSRDIPKFWTAAANRTCLVFSQIMWWKL